MKFYDLSTTFDAFLWFVVQIWWNVLICGSNLMKFDDCWSKNDEIDQIITVTGLIIPGINKFFFIVLRFLSCVFFSLAPFIPSFFLFLLGGLPPPRTPQDPSGGQNTSKTHGNPIKYNKIKKSIKNPPQKRNSFF